MNSLGRVPITRETWQDYHAANNFDGPEQQRPFLPPLTVVDDDFLAAKALVQTVRNSVDPNGRLREGDDENTLRMSPNWNALAGNRPLTIPEEDDPYIGAFLDKRANKVRAASNAVRDMFPAVAERVRQGVRLGIQEGYMPEVAAQRLETALTKTAIQVVDHIVLGDGTIGSYEANKDKVELSSAINVDDVPIAVVHELLGHKSAGGAFHAAGAGSRRPVRSRMGFNIIKRRHSGFDEAIAHHLSLASMNGDFATLDPDKRSDGDRTYDDYRKLAAAFVVRSNGVVDLRHITRSAFEDSDEATFDIAERRTMVEQARQAFGGGAYRKLDILYWATDQIPENATSEEIASYMQELASRIHGPVVDKHGRVIVAGYIDVTGLPQHR